MQKVGENSALVFTMKCFTCRLYMTQSSLSAACDCVVDSLLQAPGFKASLSSAHPPSIFSHPLQLFKL